MRKDCPDQDDMGQPLGQPDTGFGSAVEDLDAQGDPSSELYAEDVRYRQVLGPLARLRLVLVLLAVICSPQELLHKYS